MGCDGEAGARDAGCISLFETVGGVDYGGEPKQFTSHEMFAGLQTWAAA